ncbi:MULTISPECIES: dodecin family protein [Draconibacterium]|uniref:Transporter n=1 Tax=Draconibacterium sediminis TaxID=1544798 RepID=A0A0D8JB53_9BACT|nr:MULTISPECIES: dodecin family protein [Draconibacterium]KJF43038.1 transporter [Draconibacterium sediminis]
MPNSVYKIVELIGSSPVSWEQAAQNAISTASKSLRDLRIAEVCQMDIHITEGEIECYRVKLKVSFKYEN